MLKEWYLLQFKPNSHRIAESNLNRQGFETFLPLQKITKRRSSSFVNYFTPLFPGYMFVSFDINSPLMQKIKSTIGVSRLVLFEGKAKPIPIELLESIKLQCESRKEIGNFHKFKSGSKIKLKSGPFTSFVARIEKIDADSRIHLLFDFMGRSTLLKVPAHEVE